MLRSYKGIWPKLGERVYVDVSAQVVGDVVLGDHSSVWMNAVVRGDVNSIRIGAHTNIQDNCVVHVFKGTHPTVVGDHVTVGHSVTVHGCHVGEECIVGAQTLVPEGMIVPPGSLVIGVPAKVRRPITDEERAGLRRYAENYYEYKETYLEESGKA
jgi:carbonic anhydrase/acetyltransferase-like protein (isoleucine patch superfamily)